MSGTVWVTGGAGFLGTAVVNRLLESGRCVRCLVRSRTAADALRLKVAPAFRARLDIVHGTLNSPADCRQLVAGCSVGIHGAAALTGATASLFLNNVVTTRQLLAAIGSGSSQRIVLVSSIAIHGTSHLGAGAVLDERCPVDPHPEARDPYTFSKIAQERVCWDAVRASGLRLVVVRPGVIYGPGRDCVTSRVGLRVGPVLVQMGGRHRLPYTYVENCADAIVHAAFAAGVEGEAFNITDDELPTGNEVLRRYRRWVGPVRTVTMPTVAIQPLSRLYHWYSRQSKGQLPPVLTAYRSSASWKPLRYSNEKARRAFGWEPRVPLAEALDRTLAAWKEQTA